MSARTMWKVTVYKRTTEEVEVSAITADDAIDEALSIPGVCSAEDPKHWSDWEDEEDE